MTIVYHIVSMIAGCILFSIGLHYKAYTDPELCFKILSLIIGILNIICVLAQYLTFR